MDFCVFFSSSSLISFLFCADFMQTDLCPFFSLQNIRHVFVHLYCCRHHRYRHRRCSRWYRWKILITKTCFLFRARRMWRERETSTAVCVNKSSKEHDLNKIKSRRVGKYKIKMYRTVFSEFNDQPQTEKIMGSKSRGLIKMLEI